MLEFSQKVFGLGLSKTGTSSLTDALNLLGVRSIHYPHDERTYDELQSGNYRLSLLEEYQGVADIPVAPFYAQLDGAFPGSKFILTVREREAWLRSCEAHWRLMSEWWNNFPAFKKFHAFISACVYGTLQFKRERFAYVYETHERNVRQYFAGRPGDLLLLDICGGEGWEKLCPFLGLPVPDAPFPHANEWMHRLMQASEDVAGVIPAGETFILVDEAGFGSEFANDGRRALPFLERSGDYWGAPADDATAIRELERMRREHDARFIAFGWPAFWWLDYYGELHAHLRTSFRCVLDNERVVIFDLRSCIR
ncbi:MAG TPA: sulfotransferase [Pyrinomonadaceae bacterium]|nr:sulfotransferase [Pyrinomonadaceae bacterium]